MRLRLPLLATRGIRGKIYLICGLLVVPFIMLAVATTIMVRLLVLASDDMQAVAIPVIEGYEGLRVSGLRVIETTNTFALLNTFGLVEGEEQNSFSIRKKKDLLKARDEFALALAVVKRFDARAGSESQRFRDSVVFAYRDILNQSDKIVRLVAKGAPPNAVLSARERFENRAVNFRNLIDAAIDAEKGELSVRQNHIGESMRLTLAIVGAGGVLGLLLALVASQQLFRRLAKPIDQLREAARRVGDGELDALRHSPLQSRRDSDEISELVRTFGKMSDRLQQLIRDQARSERLAVLGQLAATVSHELRNPLAAIRASIALVHQQTAGKGLGTERALERADRNIDRCTRIIGDLLEFTRGKNVAREPIELWLIRFLDEHAVPGGVPVERDFRDAGVVEIDPERFRQVLVNLVDNAAQALIDKAWQPADGHRPRIVLRTEAIGREVALSVIDNGPGIAGDTLSKIFEPLFTTKSFGVGLGLPTVRRLVEQHGGSIAVESRLEQGTTFTVRLPRSATLIEENAA
jgi:signal transduction histidine kinase